MYYKFVFKKILLVILLVSVPLTVVYAADPSSNPWDIYFPDIIKMMDNLNENMPSVVRFLVAFSYITGIWFVFSAINELRLYGQARTMMPGNIHFTGPLSRFMVGVALIFLPGIIDISIYSLWGTGASVLEYPIKTSDVWAPMIKGGISLVRVVGYIAFIRGFILYTRASKQGAQPGMASKATTHIIGGILAINIVGTINILRASFGIIS